MLFNSPSFGVFLLLALGFYYALPPSLRKTALFIISWVYYGLWSVPYLALLAAASLLAYGAALGIERRPDARGKKRVMAWSVVLLLASLAVFKYSGLLAALARLAGPGAGAFERVLVPLGISYYTFKLISYVIDVYWEKMPAEKDFTALALYTAFFPQILSGPIQRADDFLPQIKRPLENDPGRVLSGLRLALFGLFKKIVVADSLALYVNAVYADPLQYNSVCVLLACYAFVFQLYADFSGFTDIAIGVGRLFGIESPKNFNLPFFSPNIQVFWRNWHITLTRWLADYVFMPLRMAFRGAGDIGLAAAVSVNFILIGLWHDATGPFLAFGLLHAVYMCVSVFTLQKRDAFFDRRPFLARARAVWAPLITFHLWTVSEVFFRAESLAQAGQVFQALLALDLSKPWVLFFGKRAFIDLSATIALMEIVHWAHARGKLAAFFAPKAAALRWTAYYVMTLLVLYYAQRGSEQFIYFKF